jgi:hypothetical protein
MNDERRPPERPRHHRDQPLRTIAPASAHQPAILIRLPLEGAPQVIVAALHNGDGERLHDWIDANPEYVELVRRALALERRERAA